MTCLERKLRKFLKQRLSSFRFVIVRGNIYLLFDKHDTEKITPILNDLKQYFNVNWSTATCYKNLWQSHVRSWAYDLRERGELTQKEYDRIIRKSTYHY
jgi:hypothetical protein